ncbi:hypothetical protein [Comamonas composti]|uniref:hypothetical protein n=1 Tax=Comamonas composti TaxID=408558 RepID=UPI00047D6870|nr:hypothetical protein [Comamonas composti]
MRSAHALTPFLQAAVLAALFILLSSAQARDGGRQPASAAVLPDFLDPEAPRLRLQHQPLHQGTQLIDEPGDWHAANAAVARFASGHGDILKWEAAQESRPADPETGHHLHGGRP